MKRLNPKTGVPFKHGDIREDGYVFGHYRTTRKPKKDGYWEELWYSSEVFDNKSQYNKKYLKDKYKTLEGRAEILIASAKKRGTLTISNEWIVEKLKIGFCELSGLPFDLSQPSKSHNFNPYSPSLDRINPNLKEYSPKNTRLVLTCVNLALNQYGLEHFLKVANAVIDKQKGNKNE